MEKEEEKEEGKEGVEEEELLELSLFIGHKTKLAPNRTVTYQLPWPMGQFDCITVVKAIIYVSNALSRVAH